MADEGQRFTVSRLQEAHFTTGMRAYFQDRDLGIAEATGGRAMAVVHRACAPCPPGGSGMHLHRLEFQMNYLLKGWLRVALGDGEEIEFKAGDAWLQPPEIPHNVTGFSEDLEVLEITLPAGFETEEVRGSPRRGPDGM